VSWGISEGARGQYRGLDALAGQKGGKAPALLLGAAEGFREICRQDQDDTGRLFRAAGRDVPGRGGLCTNACGDGLVSGG